MGPLLMEVEFWEKKKKKDDSGSDAVSLPDLALREVQFMSKQPLMYQTET